MKLSGNAVTFVDNHLLVAVKPPGIPTQPDFEEWAKEWVKQHYNKKGNVFLHAVHRLDKPVSGLVLFARTSKALSRLNEQVRNQEIERAYLAEIEGILPQKEGRLDHYLVHGDHQAFVKKEGYPEAKHARLTYQVLHFSPHSTFVLIHLETGRYHQIRCQFAAIGHPVVGDRRYGAEKNLEAIHLHSAQLALKHPVTQEVCSWSSAAPFTYC